MTKSAISIAVWLVVAQAVSAQQLPERVVAGPAEICADRIREHMAFLADDALEGRATGTRGFDAAARYVAAQFEALGLRPVSGAYQQDITIRRLRVVERETSLTIVRGGLRESLVYGKDFVSYGETSADKIDLTGEVVFVGESEAAFFDDAETKAANAADHGAAALLLVEEEHIPWELRVRAARQLEQPLSDRSADRRNCLQPRILVAAIHSIPPRNVVNALRGIVANFSPSRTEDESPAEAGDDVLQ